MENIHLVTDSTSYLPPEMIDGCGVEIVPLRVIWGSESWREGEDISSKVFIDRLRQGNDIPTTSQPSAGEFATCYRKLGERGGKIISIHISGDLSGTVAAAEAAKSMVSDLDIRIIDSRITCLGLGFMVCEAARLRDAGKTTDQIVAGIEEQVKNSKAYFMVDDLNYLHRGGRIGAAQAALGSLLQVKPILCMEDAKGTISIAEKVRTKKKALARLVELTAQAGQGKKVTATVIHADNVVTAIELKQALETAIPDADIVMSEFGPVIATHVGPGTVGIIFYTS